MSDYFGALMRSSGIDVGGRPPQGSAPPAATAQTLEAIETQIDVAAPGAEAPPMRAAPAESAPTPLRAAAAFAAPGLAHPARASIAAGAAESAATEPVRDTDTGLETPRSDDATMADAPTRAASTRQALTPESPAALGQVLVRAALQWVAADPQQPPSDPPAQRRQEAREPPIDPARAVAMPAASSFVHAETRSPSADPLAATPPRPDRFVRPVTAVAAVPAPAERDERVEISIGAIHLRVDAPAAQTVARTPAPPPAAARPAPAPTAPRSALSRRTLHTI